MKHDDETISETGTPSASATNDSVSSAPSDGGVLPSSASKAAVVDDDAQDPGDSAQRGDDVDASGTTPAKSLRGRRARRPNPETIRRNLDEIARIEARRKARNDKERDRLRELKERTSKQVAAQKRTEAELFEKQESAARYRLADALLKQLATLPEPNWPTLVTKVFGERSAEDRAAIRRILGKLSPQGSV